MSKRERTPEQLAALARGREALQRKWEARRRAREATSAGPYALFDDITIDPVGATVPSAPVRDFVVGLYTEAEAEAAPPDEPPDAAALLAHMREQFADRPWMIYFAVASKVLRGEL